MYLMTLSSTASKSIDSEPFYINLGMNISNVWQKVKNIVLKAISYLKNIFTRALITLGLMTPFQKEIKGLKESLDFPNGQEKDLEEWEIVYPEGIDQELLGDLSMITDTLNKHESSYKATYL